MTKEIRPGRPNRRQIILSSAAATAATAAGGAALLQPPGAEPIPVAFLLDEGATIIDFCGPWEVFQDSDGLTSGVDAALHIVARYFGIEAARQAADYMEYGKPLLDRGRGRHRLSRQGGGVRSAPPPLPLSRARAPGRRQRDWCAFPDRTCSSDRDQARNGCRRRVARAGR